MPGREKEGVSMKSAVLSATNVIKKICYYVCYVSMILVVCMMALMFVDSMLGLFFNNRITGSYEVVQCMLCIVVFTSWAYTQTTHGHIHVVMFVRMMPQKVRFICYSLTALLSTATMGFATYALIGAIQGKMASGEATGTLLIPYWPFYVVEFVAFLVFTLALLCDTIKAIIAIKDEAIANEIMESWA